MIWDLGAALATKARAPPWYRRAMALSDPAPPLQLTAAAVTDVGRVRQNNEDAYLCLPELGLFAVADGMGGHQGGEVAADMAVSLLRRAISAATGAEYLADPSLANRRQLLGWLAQQVNEINAAIYARGNAEASLRGMGCTLDVVLVRGRGLFLAHVGDSRVYAHLGTTLYQLTEDHNLGQALFASGALSADEVAVHPQRHLLMRALGVYPKVDVDTMYLDLAPGDKFLLCSDGVYGMVATEPLDQAMQSDPTAAAHSIIREAMEGGGRDNATAVVLHVSAGQSSQAVRVGSPAARRAMAAASLFAGFSDRELLRVQKIASVRTLLAGEVALRENEPGHDLGLVVEGKLSAWRDGTQIGVVGPGDPFGNLALHPTPYVATMRAEETTSVLVFPIGEIEHLLSSDVALAAKLAMNALTRVWQRFWVTTAAASRLLSSGERPPTT
jgi:serine/threonine protein phosphatase PrpC